jgi:hypothetical protein
MLPSDSYINHLLEPYTVIMNEIQTVNMIKQWIMQIIPDYINSINFTDLEAAKCSFINQMVKILITDFNKNSKGFQQKQLDLYENNLKQQCKSNSWSMENLDPLISPWALARYRNRETSNIFGPTTEELMVIVDINGEQFEHLMSEDLVMGLSYSIGKFPYFKLFLYGSELTFDFLSSMTHRSYNPIDSPYLAYFNPHFLCPNLSPLSNHDIKEYNVHFSSPEFIQGVLTGGMWTYRNPHKIVDKLFMKDIGGTETLMTF